MGEEDLRGVGGVIVEDLRENIAVEDLVGVGGGGFRR